MNVWVAVKRAGIDYHLIDGNSTARERFIGHLLTGDEPTRGFVLPIIRAVDDYAAHVCPRCAERAGTVGAA